MIAQVINISFPGVAEYYRKKYNLGETAYRSDIKALEIRGLQPESVSDLYGELTSHFKNCYKFSENNSPGILIIDSYHSLLETAELIHTSDIKISNEIRRTIKCFPDRNNIDLNSLGTSFNLNEPLIMGILNITPDSFSDGGRYFSADNAIAHALELISDGADIIDIGGESTRPGAKFISQEEEIKRVIPVIEKIKEVLPGTILSVDTTKRQIAFEALKRGVRIINDISGFTQEPEIIDVVKEFGAALVIMHMKGTPRNMQAGPFYEEVVSEVFDFLKLQADKARAAGVKDIIIDPGIGFGKRISDNYELLGRLDEFKSIGLPVLIGLSRKSFLGKSLGLDIKERDMATVITETLGLRNGANIIRTHNVKNAMQARKIYSFISNPEKVSSDV